MTKGALPLDQALRTVIEIADALDKAHSQKGIGNDTTTFGDDDF